MGGGADTDGPEEILRLYRWGYAAASQDAFVKTDREESVMLTDVAIETSRLNRDTFRQTEP